MANVKNPAADMMEKAQADLANMSESFRQMAEWARSRGNDQDVRGLGMDGLDQGGCLPELPLLRHQIFHQIQPHHRDADHHRPAHGHQNRPQHRELAAFAVVLGTEIPRVRPGAETRAVNPRRKKGIVTSPAKSAPLNEVTASW